jgi:large subunit ribosomal protein L7Ae
MAKSYVKFEVAKEVSDKALEAVRLAKQTGTIRKGINEVTKSVERGLALLVVMAEDIEPEEIAMHLPILCDQKKITYVYVPTKTDLGKAVGMNITCSSVAIEKAGDAESSIKEVVSKITGKSVPSKEQPKEQHHKETKSEHKPKTEKKEESKGE